MNNSGASNLLLGGNELQEVAVVSNAYTGQYGRQAGAQVDYSTKSGSNSFHGNAVYNWTGRALNANDPLNKLGQAEAGEPNERPFENNNQWAASFGGPIIKDKAFFFVNTEGIRYIFAAGHTVTYPDAGVHQLRARQRSARRRHAVVLQQPFQSVSKRTRILERDSERGQLPQLPDGPWRYRRRVHAVHFRVRAKRQQRMAAQRTR